MNFLFQLVRSLPRYPHQACAIAFSNVAPEIAVAYTNQTVSKFATFCVWYPATSVLS